MKSGTSLNELLLSASKPVPPVVPETCVVAAAGGEPVRLTGLAEVTVLFCGFSAATANHNL